MAKNTQVQERANQIQFGDFGGTRLEASESTNEVVACFIPQEDSTVSYTNAPDNGKGEVVTARSFGAGIPVYGRLENVECVTGAIDVYFYG